MSDGLPRSEYDVNYLQIIIFVVVFISLLLLSFFAGYYAGKKSSVRTSEKTQITEKPKVKKIINKPTKTNKANLEVKQTSVKSSVKKNDKKIINAIPEKQVIHKKKQERKDVSQTKKRVYRRGYYIQVAAFKDLKSAEKKAKIYRRKFKVIIYYPKDKEKTKWYRLWIGPYSNKTRVKRALIRLEKEFKIKGFIRKLD